MYINDLSSRLPSLIKIFADDITLFSVANDVRQSANELSVTLGKISNSANQ